MRKFIVLLSSLTLTTACSTGIKVEFREAENAIEVLFNGELFTAYRYGPELTKPILFPVHSPSGVILNRSYPFAEVEGESKDHPHHTGIFFTYDEVNEDGFWNNTTTPPQIKHISVLEQRGGSGQGALSTLMHWVGVSGKTLLEERRTMTFYPGVEEHKIDFDITLTAVDTTITFHDTKEGMFAIRVAPWLKERGGNGRYLSSNGDETEQNVWGKRAGWVRLEGDHEGQQMGIAILNHPSSTNYPTYWHARAYGLFAANPLGQSVFESSRGQENPQPLNLVLQPGESAPFRFMMIMYEGSRDVSALDQEFAQYQ